MSASVGETPEEWVDHRAEALRHIAMTNFSGSDETTAAIVAVAHALLSIDQMLECIANRIPTGGDY